MDIKLFDSELKVMDVLWKQGDTPAREIARALGEELGWNVNTTYTLIKRCMKKGAIERTEPGFLCHALLPKAAVQEAETDELINRRQRCFLFLHQTDAVVIRLGGDEGLVLLEDVVHEGDDGVVALRYGLFEGIVVISRDVPLDIRLAGEDLIAARFEDVRKEHGRAFARVGDVGLEAHAEHGDLRR